MSRKADLNPDQSLKPLLQPAALAGTFALANGTNGTAEITYSATAGADLSSTKLDNQADAEGALTTLNAAITDVAAQDGYIGAQINTLNAVSHVLSTQQKTCSRRKTPSRPPTTRRPPPTCPSTKS